MSRFETSGPARFVAATAATLNRSHMTHARRPRAAPAWEGRTVRLCRVRSDLAAVREAQIGMEYALPRHTP
ncbi:hypothetical protein C9I57_05615 [Trinickia symbiotica]|uniref:Uncharacterized protein n=1 Tax=Trinickia symbiotica TaxID=863227 RepID=A0A2T3XZX9_9BURK|nr:hypothetical protein C9I57_05615 [Trinickia symbiotica]